jgi:diacylglycerol kinase family enzyme
MLQLVQPLEAPTPAQTAILVVNRTAGTIAGLPVADVAARVTAALETMSVHMVEIGGDDTAAILDRALEGGAHTLVALGGDGTARVCARHAMKHDVPIIPLPGGTMNVLAKRVFGHGELDRAIADLAALRPAVLNVGSVGGEPFFLSAAFGFAGPLARLREAMRPPRRFDALAAAASACARGLGPSLRGGIGWRVADGTWQRAHTLAIALGSVDRVVAPDSAALTERDVAVEAVAVNLRTGWDVARLSLAALGKGWRKSPVIEVTRGLHVELDLRTRRPLAVLDGEPMRLGRSARVDVHAGALKIMVPAHRPCESLPPAV